VSDDRWQKQWDIFHEALEQPAAARELFVMDTCGDDTELCSEVLNLLDSHSESDDFLEEPIVVAVGALDALDPKSLLGSSIDAYLLEDVIGEGGMGIVYAAEQKEPVQRNVALKVIRLGMNTEEVVKRFQLERQALAMMDHPCIAKVFDAGVTEDGRPYFVMERVDGVSVTRFCDKNRLSIRERLDLFCTICDALQHAHQKGVIHRDIKPSNVLVSVDDHGNPVPRIIDFGIAKATNQRITEKSVFTQLGRIIGTPAYMSPEQAGLDASAVDTRSDIYSLSVLLYELLTSTTPFPDESLLSAGYVEMQRIICDDDPPAPSTRLSNMAAATIDTVAEGRRTTRSAIRDQVSGDLDWVIMKALDKTPERRYASAAEFAADIRRHLSDQPVSARPPSNVYRMGKFYRRHRAGVNAGILALIVGIAFSVATVIQSRELAAALVVAEIEQEKANQVTRFLINVLTQSNPHEAQGEEITVREALNKSAESLDTELSDQPDVKLAILINMSNVYRELGLYDEARNILEMAISLESALLETHSGRVGSWYVARAELEHDLGKLDEAEPFYVRALELISGVHDEHVDLVASKSGYGQFLTERARYDEAELLLLDAHAMARRLLGDDDATTVRAALNLAVNYFYKGDYDNALPLSREAVATNRRVHGPDSTRNALAQATHAVFVKRLGHYEEAKQAELEAVSAYRAVMGERHYYVAIMLGNVASTASYLGQLDEAERYAVEAISIYDELFDENHSQRSAAVNNLAHIYFKQAQYEDAEQLFQQVLAADRATHGDDHINLSNSIEMIASTLRMRGRQDEAIPLNEQALALRQKHLEPQHPNIARAQIQYAASLTGAGRLDDAEAQLTRALEILQSAQPTDPLRLSARTALGQLYKAQGRLTEAETVYRQTVDTWRESQGDHNPDLAASLHWLGEVLVAQNNNEEARVAIAEAVAIRGELYGPDHPDAVASRELLQSVQ